MTANPRPPALLGITLDGNGVAKTQVVVINRSTGERLIGAADANKVVVFDAAEFPTLYVTGQVIDFQNVGASVGTASITLDTVAGFQQTTMSCAAAPTVSVDL